MYYSALVSIWMTANEEYALFLQLTMTAIQETIVDSVNSLAYPTGLAPPHFLNPSPQSSQLESLFILPSNQSESSHSALSQSKNFSKLTILTKHRSHASRIPSSSQSPKSTLGLLKVTKEKVEKITPKLVEKALSATPKGFRKVYNVKGNYIENFMYSKLRPKVIWQAWYGQKSQMTTYRKIGVHEAFRSASFTTRLPGGIFQNLSNSI
ncbi:UNVERIFIED_CONTAM: hypothetical protein NCL1_37480 [Trichonephila clavipes]